MSNCFMTFKTFLKKTKIYLTHFDQAYFERLSYSFNTSGDLLIFLDEKILRYLHKSCLPFFYTEINTHFYNNFSVFNMYDEHIVGLPNKKNIKVNEGYYSNETYFYILLSEIFANQNTKSFTDILDILLMSTMFLKTVQQLRCENLLELDQFYLSCGHILTHMTDVEILSTKDLNCVSIEFIEDDNNEYSSYSRGFNPVFLKFFTIKKQRINFDLSTAREAFNLRMKTNNWKATSKSYFYLKPEQAQKLLVSRLKIAKTKNAELNDLNSYYGVFGIQTAGYNNTGKELSEYEFDGDEEC